MNRKSQSPHMIVSLMLIAVLLVSGCDALFGSTFEAGCSENLDDIVAMLRPDLTASANVLEQSCTEGFAPGNATVRVKFTLSPDEVDAFMQSTPISEWALSVPADYTYNGAPVNAESVSYGTYGDGVIYMEILIDTHDPTLYTIYYVNSYVD